MKKVILTYGIIAGGILGLVMFIFIGLMGDSISYSAGMYIGYTSMILAFSMVFFGTKSYRDKIGDGTISFGRALGVGLLISLVASIIYSATWMLIQHFMIPDFYEKYAAHQAETMKAAGASADELAQMQSYMDMVKNPVVKFFFTLLEPLPVAVLVPFISSFILKRKTVSAAQ